MLDLVLVIVFTSVSQALLRRGWARLELGQFEAAESDLQACLDREVRSFRPRLAQTFSPQPHANHTYTCVSCYRLLANSTHHCVGAVVIGPG